MTSDKFTTQNSIQDEQASGLNSASNLVARAGFGIQCQLPLNQEVRMSPNMTRSRNETHSFFSRWMLATTAPANLRAPMNRVPIALSNANSSDMKSFNLDRLMKKSEGTNFKPLLRKSAYALVCLTLLNPKSAVAAKAAETVEHLHTGQKVANFFMGFGLPKWAVLSIISAMPVVELRGAVPVGIWLGMPIAQVLPICVLGNMIPIVPMLYLLRNAWLK